MQSFALRNAQYFIKDSHCNKHSKSFNKELGYIIGIVFCHPWPRLRGCCPFQLFISYIPSSYQPIHATRHSLPCHPLVSILFFLFCLVDCCFPWRCCVACFVVFISIRDIYFYPASPLFSMSRGAKSCLVWFRTCAFVKTPDTGSSFISKFTITPHAGFGDKRSHFGHHL